MIGGSIIVGLSLMLIGWTKETVSLFISTDSEHHLTFVIWLAIISIYFLDFALNAGISPVFLTNYG
jgi:solute carrier family 45, member 1/2/4